MADEESRKPQGDTPAPYCKLSRAEAAKLAELGLSGMQYALYLIYASERRQVKGEPGIYCATCGDERAAGFLLVERVRALRLRKSLIAKGAIACATRRNGRTPSRVYFPMQNEAIAEYLNGDGEDAEALDEHAWLDDYLRGLQEEGHSVSADYLSEWAGRVKFDTSDVHKTTRVNADTAPVQKLARQTCMDSHARRVTDSHARRARIDTPDVHAHSGFCTGIQSNAQVGPTNDDLCNYEEGEGDAAASACAAAHPFPAETKPRTQPPNPNVEVLRELGLAGADVAQIGETYYLCPRCGHPVVRRPNTGLACWYDCVKCGLDVLVGRDESGNFDIPARAAPSLIPSKDIRGTMEQLKGA